MSKNNKEINSKKALEGTLCKLFGFKRVQTDGDDYWLQLCIKCKDFNVMIIVEDLQSMELLVQTKNAQNLHTMQEGKYNFNRLKMWVNRYNSLK